MLDQVTAANAVLLSVSQDLPYGDQLVVAGKDLLPSLLLGLRVFLFNDLGIVFQNIGQPILGKDFLPEVIRGQAMRVWWISRSVVVPLVEREEPGALALELGAHADFMVVHREMDGAPAELEQQFFRITVELVLLHGIQDGLFGELVLEFEGGEGQAVDEHCQIKGESGPAFTVMELPRYAEDVHCVELDGLDIPGRRRSIKQIRVHRAMFESLAQDFHDTALGNLTLKAMQELGSIRSFFRDIQLFVFLRLC